MLFRTLRKNETDLLKDFLYEAIVIPEGIEPPDRSIVKQPELKIYYECLSEKMCLKTHTEMLLRESQEITNMLILVEI